MHEHSMFMFVFGSSLRCAVCHFGSRRIEAGAGHPRSFPTLPHLRALHDERRFSTPSAWPLGPFAAWPCTVLGGPPNRGGAPRGTSFSKQFGPGTPCQPGAARMVHAALSQPMEERASWHGHVMLAPAPFGTNPN